MKRYMVQPAGGEPVLADALDARGWKATDGSDWSLLWSPLLPRRRDIRTTTPGQWVNRHLGIVELFNKSRLARNLTHHRALMAKRPEAPSYDFFPETFVLPSEYGSFRRAAGADPKAIWIRKPNTSANGRGVRLVTDLDRLATARSDVVQRYVDRPHLKGGFKYEISLYVGLTSLDPLVAYLHRDGLVKLTTRPFTTDRRRWTDPLVHVTNTVVQGRNQEVEPGQATITLATYREWLRAEGIDAEALFGEIRGLIIRTLASVREPMLRWAAEIPVAATSFDFYCFDVLVDADLKPWLLEGNIAPNGDPPSSSQIQSVRLERALKQSLVRDLLELVGVDAPPSPLHSDEAIVARFDGERSRAGGFERIYPAEDAGTWLSCLTWPRRSDWLLARHECLSLSLEPWRLSPRRVRALPLGDRLVLVSEETGAVRTLNSTAAYTWLRVEEGAGADDVAQELAARFNHPYDMVRTDVDSAIAGWIELGLTDVGDGDEAIRKTRRGVGTIRRTCRFALAGLAIEVRLPAGVARAARVVAPAAGGREPVVGVVDVVPDGRGYVLRTPEGLAIICDHPDGLVPALRALLIQRVAHRTSDGCLAIPASVVCGSKGAVLIADPRRHLEQRLAVACALDGMRLVCSELTILDACFKARSTALPPPLPGADVTEFVHRLPRIAAVPRHRSADGTPVRYLPGLARGPRGRAVEIGAIVFPVPARGRHSRLAPLDPCIALERLIALGLIRFPGLDADTLEPVVAWLDQLLCQELKLADLAHGVELIRHAHG
jgi:hypothetical protein